MLVKNTISQTYIVHDGNLLPHRIFKDFVFDASLYTAIDGVFPKCNALLYQELLKKPDSKVLICRQTAMGDLIMIVPVLRHLIKKFPNIKIDLFTNPSYKWIFSQLSDNVCVYDSGRLQDYANGDYYYKVLLDNTLERDHLIPKYNNMHRVENYCETLGIPFKDVLPDYSILDDSKCIKNNSIVFQLRGSTDAKKIDIYKLKYVISEIAKKYEVFPTDYSNFGGIFNNMNNVNTSLLNSSILDTANAINNAGCVVSFDSGILWVAHSTKTPTVAILGPTSASSRLSFAPMPIKHIDLAEMVGCKKRCNELSIDNFRCMRTIDKDALKNAIIKNIDELLKAVK